MSGKQGHIRGTREWAVATVDCCTGCSHDCIYCYGRHEAVVKKGTATALQWGKPVLQPEQVNREYPRYPGTVMFPANHDILPEFLGQCIEVIGKLLDSGNHVLIVTKPHLECVRAICAAFTEQKSHLLFRFTITAYDDDILHLWEPGAPVFSERLESLKWAFFREYGTSVSVEPMLDADNVLKLVSLLEPYVNHSIWLGKMNKISKRVICHTSALQKDVDRLIRSQSDGRIQLIYQALKDNPLIRWKDSIKQVVGIPSPAESGLDI